MRKAIVLVLLVVLGTMPLQTSAQVSVPGVDLHCDNSYQDNTNGPAEPMGYIDTSESNNNTTIFSPIQCTVSNPNSYVERIQIQMNANGLTLSAPGTITLSPNDIESFEINATGELGMSPRVVILNVTATVVEANGAPPPNTAQDFVEGEIWIINDEYEEPQQPVPCYTTFSPEMIHAANNWRFVDLYTRYTSSDGEIINSKIKIQLNHSAAPQHSENFALLTLSGCYDNSIFHRIIEGFVIQGGDFQNNVGTGGYAAKWYGYCNGKTISQDGVSYTEQNCPFELWSIPGEHENGLRHKAGVIAAAHAGVNTDGAQFYIVPTGSEPYWLDWEEGKDCSQSSCHTVFGEVIEGQNHVDAISEVDTGQNDRPVNDVTIISALLSNGTDTDGDGTPDDFDDFPNDANETADSDGDGVGNNADAFPNDANETLDSDGDGIGDNSDAFPNDENETHDDDGDGVGNNTDAFPDDPDETHDDDGDGVGNNTDEFPQDPDEQFDNDGDGVGNNADDFPDNKYASNWSTIYAAVGTFIVLLIGAGVMISRMKQEDELPNVPATNDLAQIEKQIQELERMKAGMLEQQDPTELMFED
ncbi:MAG: peptidylprolyl isomerase [Candidatus Poseidoniaceae archaeon]